MKSFFLLSIFLIFESSHLIAQEAAKGLHSKESNKISFLTLDIVPPIFYAVPRWNIGFYKVLNPKVIVGAELGYGSKGIFKNRLLTPDYIDAQQYKVLEIAPELIIIEDPYRETKRFISVSASFIRHKDTFGMSHYKEDDPDSFIHFSSADYQRTKFSLTVSSGLIFNISKRIGIITKLGPGIRVRSVKFSNLADPYKGTIPFPERPFKGIAYGQEGTRLSADVNFDFRLFFKF